ncbi:DivIVA domain-containing protein [Pseudoclavibacter caeni]|jgi:DivIVA domain-containing protein|uniref:DivIVA domain-containing protein n=1 Tax=Pseudoclavibacter caeni TaxID=908846 RepID=A0A7C8BN90_9MICO|nr:DivIVA domain-containing protein [Pseudoclavibacter caeni]KAB1632303.1 DivIVA domain-containing protein [Pseudoclavibacter caeni]NYJ97535.1 DivIVA domain-containing protein [Pseudoclavibacter caeni]
MTVFERVPKRRRGYDIDQVDDLLERARVAYDTGGGDITAETVRTAAFDLVREGYDPKAVDAALDRLEEAFAMRERDEAIAAMGEGEWQELARDQARVVVARLLRQEGHRFRRAGIFGVGYNRHQVDRLGDRIVAYFRTGEPLAIEEVRDAVFARQGNGYSERQVDALLDRTVEIMLAVG